MALLARYERRVRPHKDLRPRDDVKGEVTVAAISVLAERSADRIEEAVYKGLAGKGFSDRPIKAAPDHVHEQLWSPVRYKWVIHLHFRPVIYAMENKTGQQGGAESHRVALDACFKEPVGLWSSFAPSLLPFA